MMADRILWSEPFTLKPETETVRLYTAAAALQTDLKSSVEAGPPKKKRSCLFPITNETFLKQGLDIVSFGSL